MEPVLIGGLLIFLVGSVMLGFTLSGVNVGLGHSLLIQFLGAAMVAAFFLHAGEFSLAQVKLTFATIQRQVTQGGGPSSSTVTLQAEQGVTAVTVGEVGGTTSSPSGSSGVTAVVGNDGPVTAVVAAAEKKVDEKPIYKCTDQAGKETYSSKPCAGSAP